MSKILDLNELKNLRNDLRKKKKTIVYCHGVFDLLHIGHIKHFQKAKTFGDILVVSLTSDQHVNKGPGRPFFNENLRLEALKSLSVIDYVVINNNPDSANIIEHLKPDFYCKGIEYKNKKKDITKKIYKEINILKKNNGKIIFTDEPTFSSSKLINSHIFQNKKDLNFLNNFEKKKIDLIKIKKKIEKLKILIIGETIIDKYVFCRALGKSGKEPILNFKFVNEELYLGGAGAVANNVSQFSKKVTLCTMIGDTNNLLNFIQKKLEPNIKLNFFKKKNSSTIIKEKLIDNSVGYLHKIVGVYKFNDENLDLKNENRLNKYLFHNIKKFDLVIVLDYGHGFISNNTAKIISLKSSFFSLNAQINAANSSHHSINKYSNVDCLVLNEKEIRHEMRNNNDELERLAKDFANKQKIKNILITRGNKGSILYNRKNKKLFYADAYASKVVDKIGAGDAMLAIFSILKKLNLDNKVSLLFSSLAAAQAVESVGNKEKLNSINLFKSFQTLLKS